MSGVVPRVDAPAEYSVTRTCAHYVQNRRRYYEHFCTKTCRRVRFVCAALPSECALEALALRRVEVVVHGVHARDELIVARPAIGIERARIARDPREAH